MNETSISIYLVDGLENTTSLTFELDKPYTVQRDDAEEITVCSKGNNSSSHSQEKDNVLIYMTDVPIKVDNYINQVNLSTNVLCNVIAL